MPCRPPQNWARPGWPVSRAQHVGSYVPECGELSGVRLTGATRAPDPNISALQQTDAARVNDLARPANKLSTNHRGLRQHLRMSSKGMDQQFAKRLQLPPLTWVVLASAKRPAPAIQQAFIVVLTCAPSACSSEASRSINSPKPYPSRCIPAPPALLASFDRSILNNKPKSAVFG